MSLLSINCIFNLEAIRNFKHISDILWGSLTLRVGKYWNRYCKHRKGSLYLISLISLSCILAHNQHFNWYISSVVPRSHLQEYLGPCSQRAFNIFGPDKLFIKIQIIYIFTAANQQMMDSCWTVPLFFILFATKFSFIVLIIQDPRLHYLYPHLLFTQHK